MTDIILCGCGGRMGKAITAAAKNDCAIVAGIDINASALSTACSFPVYEKISDFPGKADVIIDFEDSIEDSLDEEALDKEIIEDVDKVFTTIKEDSISDSDLEIIKNDYKIIEKFL